VVHQKPKRDWHFCRHARLSGVTMGGAIAAYTWGFKHAFMTWHDYQRRAPSYETLKRMLRFYFGGNLVAGCVFGVGCLTYGGAMGVRVRPCPRGGACSTSEF
jgi:hypothetical protein